MIIDVTKPLQFTSDGTDIKVLTKEDGGAYTRAGLIVSLRLIKTSWKYDLDAGVDYLGRIWGHSTETEILRQIFYQEVRRFVENPEVRVEYEGEEIIVYVRDLETGETYEIDFLKGEELAGAYVESVEANESLIKIRFSKALAPLAVPDPSCFSAEVEDLKIVGRELHMSLIAEELPSRLIYAPGAVNQLQSFDGFLIDPFEVTL